MQAVLSRVNDLLTRLREAPPGLGPLETNARLYALVIPHQQMSTSGPSSEMQATRGLLGAHAAFPNSHLKGCFYMNLTSVCFLKKE